MHLSDQQLRQLVAEACQYPSGSLDRQKILTQIIRWIGQSQRLWQERTPYYEDALQQTWLYFCQNLCEAGTGNRYDPSRSSVITWLNYYLKWRLHNFRIAEQERQHRTAPVRSSERTEPTDVLENLAAPPDIPPILDRTRHWVETDPTGELCSTHLQHHPMITCQVLILRRLPPETSWQALAAEFGVSISTLSSFFQRQCLPRLRKFGESEGYL